jgi:hypothetical protein
VSAGALEAIDRILDRGSDVDDVLRSVVRVLTAEPGVSWAGIAFLEEGDLRLGPEAGVPDESRRIRVPVAFQGDPVGELWIDGEADPAFLERVAIRVSAHVLVGWDTGGGDWLA